MESRSLPRECLKSLEKNPDLLPQVFQVHPGIYTSDISTHHQNWVLDQGTNNCIFISTSQRISYSTFTMLVGDYLSKDQQIDVQLCKKKWYFYYIPLSNISHVAKAIKILNTKIHCLVKPDGAFNRVGVNIKTISDVMNKFLNKTHTMSDMQFFTDIIELDLAAPRSVRKLAVVVAYGHWSEDKLLQKLYFYALVKTAGDVVQENILWRLIFTMWKDKAVWDHFDAKFWTDFKKMLEKVEEEDERLQRFITMASAYSVSCIILSMYNIYSIV